MMKTKAFFSLLLAYIAIVLISCNTTARKDTNEPAVDSTLNALTQTEINEGWTLLFDGKSVDQFRGYCQDSFPVKGWEVIDGTIHCLSSGKGEAGGGGDIITRDTYKNFELSLEWKVDSGGNSGIFYLAQEFCGDSTKPIWKSAPEMQILDNEKHPDAKLGENGNRQAGSLYDLIPAVPQNAKPALEWNQVKIMVYKGTVVHYMNGEKVLEYHLWTQDWNDMCAKSKFKDWPEFVNTAEEGYIGLQDHGDNVWFRNIKIREL